MSTEFKYHPLDRTRSEIRLLEIMPAYGRSLPLKCTIRHTALGSSTYRCLSYVWGDQNNDVKSRIAITYKKPILERLKLRTGHQSSESENFRLEIGSSLAAALVHLRRKHKRVTIWADALCINQQDDEEKNWQVELMTEIYSTATHVHAWLGPRFDDDADDVSTICDAFKLVPTVAGLLRRSNSAQTFADETSWSKACFSLANTNPPSTIQHGGNKDRSSSNTISHELREALTSKGAWGRFLSAFNKLSQSEYFQRMWILQETGRARDLTFHYAEQKAPYKLLLFCLCLARPFWALNDNLANLRTSSFFSRFDPRFLTCLTARMNCDKNCTLAEVLQLAYLQPPPLLNASDPRDIIYALLGVASDGPIGIKARYELGVEYPYASATRLLLSEGFTDILLSFKPYMSSEVDLSAETFPSWAFDWSTRGVSTSFDKSKACGDTKPAISFRELPGLEHKKEMMVIRGYRLGYVTKTGDSFSRVGTTVGFGKHIFPTGTINMESPPSSNETQISLSLVFDHLRQQYHHLNVNHTLTDTETFFNESAWPIGRYGLWWIKWVLGLWNLLTTHIHGQKEDVKDALKSVLELLSVPQEDHHKGYSILHELISPQALLSSVSHSTSPHHQEPVNITVQRAFRSAYGMRPVALNGIGGHGKRYLGYGPEPTEEGDEVVVFEGVKAPLVLRKARLSPEITTIGSYLDVAYDAEGYYYYKIIGPAYICGVMEGQLFNDTIQDQPATGSFLIG
ncbi:heterokaryon incompatibility protein-domain-containing protein [Rhypophila decipiens]|uniref:Heterokaryon incompatibility protein-domain-containing protein n=1 Tax=Rhypophila decipiens TaxID=261697 RepID=A0AAN6XXP7_9PEZI|nr:heterokaryon incompatibility protein-domain-containing protein [Rhypophila decipiens]